MTLIMACPTSQGSIVIGADTRTVDLAPPLIWSNEAKLIEHSEVSLMWGYGGSVATGTQYVEDMTVNGPPPVDNWTRFLDCARTRLRDVNQERYRCGRSGDRIGVLFAGFIGDEAGIARIDITDGVFGPTPPTMRAIGSVETMAHEIWDHSVTDMTPEAAKDRIVNTFEEIVNRRSLAIGAPWEVFEVTPMIRTRLTPEW